MRLFSGKDRSGMFLQVYEENAELAEMLTPEEKSALLAVLRLHKPGFSLSFSYYGANLSFGNREGIKYEILLDSFMDQKEQIVIGSFRIKKDLANQRQLVIDQINKIISHFLIHVMHIVKSQCFD